MTILAEQADQSRTEDVGSWQPSRFTRPLCGCSVLGCGHFPTDGDKLVSFVDRHWTIADAAVFSMDPWQPALLRAVLERYPDDWPVEHLRGRLRYRQVVISMGRQNGKSVLAALFAIYFLALHLRGPRVIGLASVDRQAKIVYNRVKYAIDLSPAMSRELKTTDTRGISRRDGSGTYLTLPASEDSAQGEPATGVLYDELHLGLQALWDAMVLAQRARSGSLLVGITTAGDDGSDLLVTLYERGERAIAGEDERFGFFVWEADGPELTEAGVIAANPAVACGRIPLDTAMADAWEMWNNTKRGPDGMTGRQRCIRYTLNRFIEGAKGAWIPVDLWSSKKGQPEIVGETVYGFDRTESWEWASVTATAKRDGVFHTELVASIENPSLDVLEAVAVELGKRGPATFAMDAKTLAPLAERLRERGMEAWKLGASEMVQASQHAARVATQPGELVHAGDELVRRHVARGRRREAEGGWRLSRSLADGDTDGLYATVVGLYVADQLTDSGLQLY